MQRRRSTATIETSIAERQARACACATQHAPSVLLTRQCGAGWCIVRGCWAFLLLIIPRTTSTLRRSMAAAEPGGPRRSNGRSQLATGTERPQQQTAGRHIYRGAKWVVLRAEGKTHPPAPLAPLSASLQSLQSRARVQAPGAPSETPDQLRRQTQTHDPDVTRDGCRLRLWPAPPPAAGSRRRSPAWPCRSPRPAGSGSRGTR